MPYIIKENTYAIIPNGKKTKIIESNKNFIINETPVEVVSIIISDYNQIILLPTHSIRNKNCLWVNLNTILNYYPKEKNTILQFKNNKKIIINVSYTKFDKQVLRATRVESSLRGRNNEKYL